MGICQQILNTTNKKVRAINNKLLNQSDCAYIQYYKFSSFVTKGQKIIIPKAEWGWAAITSGDCPLKFGEVARCEKELVLWDDPSYYFDDLTKRYRKYNRYQTVEAINKLGEKVFTFNHPSFIYLVYINNVGWQYYTCYQKLVNNGFILSNCGRFYHMPGVRGDKLNPPDRPSLRSLVKDYSYDSNSIYTIKTEELSRSLDSPKKIRNLVELGRGAKRSFGVEFEVSRADLRPQLLPLVGLIPLLDGSTASGMELVTIPLRGEKGVELLYNACKELNTTCEVNYSCSLHVHIGDLNNWKPIHIAALYLLYFRIQDDILDTQPYYVRNPAVIARKNKSYCDRLPSLGISRPGAHLSPEEMYGIIRSMFMGEFETLDHYNGPKWNITSRYWALNFLPFFLGNGRVEFRVHHPTTHPIKTIAWVLICQAIVQYAFENADAITLHKMKKIKLEDVLQVLPRPIGESIWFYLEDRILLRREQFQEVSRSEAMFAGQNELNRKHMRVVEEEYNTDSLDEDYDLIVIDE